MVSTRSFFQTVLVFLGAAAVTTAAPHNARTTLSGVPYMPRIPSAAKHHQVLRLRATTEADPSVLVQATCLDTTQNIIFHDETVAQLSICGGMAGSIEKCEGALKETVGASRSAKFTVKALDDDATINISKERWVQCVQAARIQCPMGSIEATCLGGGSTGNITFLLESTLNQEEL